MNDINGKTFGQIADYIDTLIEEAADAQVIVEPLKFTPKRPTHVFECPCGCQLFYLLSDGRIECRVCGHLNLTIRHTGNSPDKSLDGQPG
jgi:hypothetical protein